MIISFIFSRKEIIIVFLFCLLREQVYLIHCLEVADKAPVVR